jgi:hypothetical protein
MSELTDSARATAKDLAGNHWVRATFGARERLVVLADRCDDMEAAIIAMLDAFEYQGDRLMGCVYDARERLKAAIGRPTIAETRPVPDWIIQRNKEAVTP